MIGRVRGVLLGVSIVLLFPFVFAHELSHGLAAWVRGYDTRVVLFPQPRASIEMRDPPRRDLLLIGFAPLVAGTIVGVAMVSGGSLPVGYLPFDLYLLAGWFVLLTPSVTDLEAVRDFL